MMFRCRCISMIVMANKYSFWSDFFFLAWCFCEYRIASSRHSMSTDELVQRIKQLELENALLKNELSKPDSPQIFEKADSTFCLEEYKRYGRQMIVPEFGSLPSQTRLKASKILVIGAGGLGCPALLYLGAAGVGKIGIVDDDTVDISNLHRQVLHTTESVGVLKCESARRYLRRLNPHVDVETHPVRLSNGNAFEIISKYDLVVDCTDTPATRYLINDVSVLCGKTIVSGSGVKTDGQFTILNFQNKGPCYRCFYPKPPRPESISTCSDAGVLGSAIGLTGVALATETIKVLTGYYDESFKPFLNMYTGYPQQTMRVFKMRSRQPGCVVCGSEPSISRLTIETNGIDYSAFCGRINTDVLAPELRISVQELHGILPEPRTILLDVRPKEQFQITCVPNSINIAWEHGLSRMDSIDQLIPVDFDKETDILYVICRYGNDSQLATRKLKDELGFKNVKDVKGGLNKWSSDIDPTIPIY